MLDGEVVGGWQIGQEWGSQGEMCTVNLMLTVTVKRIHCRRMRCQMFLDSHSPFCWCSGPCLHSKFTESVTDPILSVEVTLPKCTLLSGGVTKAPKKSSWLTPHWQFKCMFVSLFVCLIMCLHVLLSLPNWHPCCYAVDKKLPVFLTVFFHKCICKK